MIFYNGAQKNVQNAEKMGFKNGERGEEFNDIFVEIVGKVLTKNDEKNHQKIKFGMNF